MTCSCGCCDAAITPYSLEIENRPGLSAIAYRSGTFGSFREAILERLAQTPALSSLSTRLTDDYAITIVELWAAVADVVTFYNERAANEAFLRTATQRDSLLRLVRLIDYELAPAVSATASLAFTLERGAHAGIPSGTRLQSIPAQGETPQKYETTAPVDADAVLNALPIHGRPEPADLFTGLEATAAPDTAAQSVLAALAPRDRVVLFDASHLETLTVGHAEREAEDVVVRWAAAPSGTFTPDHAYKLGRSFHVFGFDAPEQTVVAEEQTPGDATSYALVGKATNFRRDAVDATNNELSLDSRYPGLKPGSRILVVDDPGSPANPAPSLCTVTHVSETNVSRPVQGGGGETVVAGVVTRVTFTGTAVAAGVDVRELTIYELLGDELRLWPHTYPGRITETEVFAAGRRSGWTSVLTTAGDLDITTLTDGRPVILTDAQASATPATVAAASLLGTGVTLSGALATTLGLDDSQSTPVTSIVSGTLDRSAIAASASREVLLTIGSARPQTITISNPADIAGSLQTAIRAALPNDASFARAVVWDLGNAIAVLPGTPGVTAEFGPATSDPTTVTALGLDPANARYIDGVLSPSLTPLLGLYISGAIDITVGIESDTSHTLAPTLLAQAGDVATILDGYGLAAIAAPDDRVAAFAPLADVEPRVFALLRLSADPAPDLNGATAQLLGNVAPAAQGETVHAEILGDGDASQIFQQFTLKKTPATPAAIQVLVDGVVWTEVTSLYAQKKTATVYTTRIADDGSLTVVFGDGEMGARLPTGRQNVVATYRRGGGLAGRVRRATLTSLLDRPTGVRSAVNPMAADGGADAETLAGARNAAPGTVRTFGRAVSLRDFEDTLLTGGVVAKASASWAWDGRRRIVHLTVAGQDGGAFSADGLEELRRTFAVERDPNQRLLIDNYTQLGIVVSGTLIVDDAYVTEDVRIAARAALAENMSFDRRAFAEPVYLGAIYAVLQDVDGVLGVDIDLLDLKSTDPTVRASHGIDDSLGQPQPRILALPARPGGSLGTVLPAELAIIESPTQDITLKASGGVAT